MTNQHQPPAPELVAMWIGFSARHHSKGSVDHFLDVANKAAQWGADMELRACCDTLQRHAHWDLAVFELMDDRRPKPPTLKEQALAAVAELEGFKGVDTIRRALEALDD